VESTSYQAKLAACGAVIDRLLAEHPDGPATRDITVNVGPYGPLGGQVNLHLSTFAAVVGWARLLNATPRGAYGSGDVIQTDFTVTVDNVAVHALGSTSCAFGDVAHEHTTCLEQARAEAASLLGELVQA
jgi:hypothetical protein